MKHKNKCAILGLLVLLTGCGKKTTVELVNKENLNFSGINGYGEFDIEKNINLNVLLNAEIILLEQTANSNKESDINKAAMKLDNYEQLISSVHCSVLNENTNLSNGDILEYKCTYDEELASKLGYKFTNSEGKITVSGLADLSNIDFTNFVEYSVEQYAGYSNCSVVNLTINLDDKTSKILADADPHYSINVINRQKDNREIVGEGDIIPVTIRLRVSGSTLEIDDEIVLTDIPHRATSADEIMKDKHVYEVLKSATEKNIKAAIVTTKNSPSIYDRKGYPKILKSEESYEYVGMYYLPIKNSKYGAVAVVYKYTDVADYNELYAYRVYENVIVNDEDKNTFSAVDKPIFSYCPAYVSLEELESTLSCKYFSYDSNTCSKVYLDSIKID